MNFKKTLEAITNRSIIKIIAYGTNEVLYEGIKKEIPNVLKEKSYWLVREIVLIDRSNYNSGYIITVY